MLEVGIQQLRPVGTNCHKVTQVWCPQLLAHPGVGWVLPSELLMPPLRFLGDTISGKKKVVTDSKIIGKSKAREKNPAQHFLFLSWHLSDNPDWTRVTANISVENFKTLCMPYWGVPQEIGHIFFIFTCSSLLTFPIYCRYCGWSPSECQWVLCCPCEGGAQKLPPWQNHYFFLPFLYKMKTSPLELF